MGIRTLTAWGAALLCASCAWGGALAGGWPGGAVPPQQAARSLQELPAWFEPGAGLAGGRIHYVSRGGDYQVVLDASGAVVTLFDDEAKANLAITLAGANPQPEIRAEDPRPGRTDYLVGQDRKRWRRGVPQYGRIRYREAYPGIDLDYRASGRRIEYDFVVSPGADPSQIRLRFPGAAALRLEEDGSLRIGLGGREIHQSAPFAFQEVRENGTIRREEVPSRYELARNGEVRLVVGAYDRSRALVIDPVLTYAGYFGGAREDIPTGVTVDKNGYIWLTGTTRSVVVSPPDTGPFQWEPQGSQDVFVAKLRIEPAGPPTLLYWSYLGGSFDDRGGSIEVIPSGRVYLTGTTYSSDFPRSSNAAQDASGTLTDMFATVLDPEPNGTDPLIYSTTLGGTGHDTATALFVAADETMYVAGYGAGYDLKSIPADALQPNNRGGYDALIFHLDPNAAAGESVRFATYFGGEQTDIATGIAADGSGNIYVTGYTMSDDFPVEGNLYQGVLKSPSDLFVIKLDPSREGLDRLVYGTYLGGSSVDIATAMVRDKDGGLWMAGYTMSADFPVTSGVFQGAHAGGVTDAFLLRFDPSAPTSQAIGYSTYFGGSGTDVFYSLQLLKSGRIALAGYTLSDDLPLAGAPPAGQSKKPGSDAMVAILDPSLAGSAALAFSSYFGGNLNDLASSLAHAPNGAVLVTGATYSPDLPVTDGSVRQAPPGSQTGFLLRLDPDPGEQSAAPPSIPEGEVDGSVLMPRRTGLSIEPQPRRQNR